MTQCRTDNGLCFHRIAMPLGDNKAYFHFVDKSIYLMGPMKSIELYHMLNGIYEPGCWFNKILARRRKFFQSRQRFFPLLPQPSWLCLSYHGKGVWHLDHWGPDVRPGEVLPF